jgi:hypothetical protein
MAGAVTQLVDKLVFPENKSPLRYDDETSATPTAGQTFSQEINLNWASASADRAIPQTDMMVFLFKDPLRAVVFYNHNQSSSPFQYQIKSAYDNGNGFPIGDCLSGYWLPGDRAVATMSYQPHSAVLYPVEANGVSGYWCDNDGTRRSKLSIRLDDATTIAGGCVEWYVWTGTQWSWWARDDFVNATDTYVMSANPPSGGAYMAAVVNGVAGMSATSVVDYQLDGSSGPATWCHYPAPNIDQLLPMIQGQRIVTAAANWQNLSSAFDESGKVTAVTVAPGLPWSNLATSANRLTAVAGYKSLLAKTGYYGFLRPTANQMTWDYSIQTCTLAGSTATNSRAKVNPDAPYIAVAMSVANANARNTTITVTHMMEYMTTSKTQEARLPDGKIETVENWEMAIKLLARTENHHPANPTLVSIFNDVIESNKRRRLES